MSMILQLLALSFQKQHNKGFYGSKLFCFFCFFCQTVNRRQYVSDAPIPLFYITSMSTYNAVPMIFNLKTTSKFSLFFSKQGQLSQVSQFYRQQKGQVVIPAGHCCLSHLQSFHWTGCRAIIWESPFMPCPFFGVRARSHYPPPACEHSTTNAAYFPFFLSKAASIPSSHEMVKFCLNDCSNQGGP